MLGGGGGGTRQGVTLILLTQIMEEEEEEEIKHQHMLQINPFTSVDLYIDVSKLGLFVGTSIYRCLLPFYHTKL